MDLREKMTSLLKKIWNQKDFILGINAHIKNEYALEAMVNYLEDNKDFELDPSDVTETALYIRFGESIAKELSPHVLEICRERGM